MKTLATIVFALMIATTGFAQTYERLLLPIYTEPTAGAYGSMWVSEFWVSNPTDTPAEAYHLFYGCQLGTCPIPTLPPKTSFRPQFDPPSDPAIPALFFYVEAARWREMAFNLRVQDISRQAQTWGTQLTVVPESEAFTRPVSLINIPLDERFRQSVRVYDFDGRAGGRLLLRIFPMDEKKDLPEPPDAAAVAEIELTLRGPWNASQTPGYAAVHDLRVAAPQLGNVGRVRIDVVPLTPGLRFWAFASITNNETQHFTTVYPR